MSEYVKKFYDEIISLPDFNGDYFQAMIDAIALAKCYQFLKDSLRRHDPCDFVDLPI